MPRIRRFAGPAHLLGSLACLAAGALVSLGLGQDANWDLLNYHLYDGAALLHGRFDQDLLAAGLQSSLNPLLDALYVWLAFSPLGSHPRVLAAAMGLWYGAAVYLAFRLGRIFYGPLTAALAALVATTGAAVVSQIGTTTNELQAGTVMLGGLTVLLRRPPATAALLISGLLFGAAAGLKLTAIAYAPAACLTVALLHAGSLPAALRAPALFAAAWCAGFLAIDGWWAWRLYHRFQNPTFPLFNGFFHSPWYPPADFADRRFRPAGLVQWLLFPLFWPSHQANPSDFSFLDLRAPLAYALALACLVVSPLRHPPRLTPPQWALLAFLASAYAGWLGTSVFSTGPSCSGAVWASSPTSCPRIPMPKPCTSSHHEPPPQWPPASTPPPT